MKLLISQLHEGPNPLAFESEKDPWAGSLVQDIQKEGFTLLSPMSLKLELTKVEPDYYLSGLMKFEVDQTCARCAEHFKLPVSHKFGVALAHVDHVRVRSGALNEDSDELDINFFEGNEIELAPIIKEQFFLSLPYQSVCKSTCLGICQHCGINLNDKKCSCADQIPTGPFSVLGNLKV